jgi:Domain of unknown function (DUF4282)
MASQEAAFCPECGGRIRPEASTDPRPSAVDEPTLVTAGSSPRQQFGFDQGATTGAGGSAGFAAPPPLPPPPAPAVDRTSQVRTAMNGFFASLFDWGFRSFVTPRLIKVGYVISAIYLALVWLLFVLVAFSTNAGFGIVVLIFGGVGALLSLMMWRLLFEFLMVVFRAAVDIHDTMKGRDVG